MMSNKSPSTSSTTSPPLLDGKSLKKEIPEDENIKDFAETAMNELLGWYGYDARVSKAGQLKTSLSGSKSPTNLSTRQPPNKSPSADDKDFCAWCNNPITNDSNPLHQSMGETFCSELCFSQSRRANFKRAKTCDWCRHIRHTVSYVDFQDGATQLQFCSDKCLNQYKMHIFCRETQAHLDLNPHLVNAATSNTNLITPELWMKNCRSRSVSPSSEHSPSPSGEKITPNDAPQSPKSNLKSANEIITPVTSAVNNITKPTHPIITVAPTSKLMKTKSTLDDKLKVQNPTETRREQKMLKVYSKRRRSSRCSSTVTSQNYLKHNNNNMQTLMKPQDLTIRSPSLSQDSSPSSSLMHTPQTTIPSPPLPLNSRIPNIHPIHFPNPMLNLPVPHPPAATNAFPNPRTLRQPFFPQHNYNLPRPSPSLPNETTRSDILPPLPQLGLGPPPPMTILVPYPIILPIPLPIPVPIPIMNFAKAYENSKWPKNEKTDTQINTTDETTNHTFSEEPIDFTMATKRKHNNNTDILNNNEQQHDNELNIDVGNDVDESNDSEVTQSEFSGHLETVDSGNPEQTLPRFKITRLGAKLSKVVLPKTKEVAESARPLRKRRRLVVEVPAEEECKNVPNKNRKTVHV